MSCTRRESSGHNWHAYTGAVKPTKAYCAIESFTVPKTKRVKGSIAEMAIPCAAVAPPNVPAMLLS